MEGKWANLPPELRVIKDRWLGASCDDNMPPEEKKNVNSPPKPPHGPQGETDQPTEVGETPCLHLRGGYDGFETVSRTSMSLDSLEYIAALGDHELEAFPLGGGDARDAPIESYKQDDRRGKQWRQGLNVDPCTHKAMTEKGKDGEFGADSDSSKRQTERRGGNCCDSEDAFGVVEPAPICGSGGGGGILGRAKNERLQENFRCPSSGEVQGVLNIGAKVSPPQSLERGVTSKPSKEARRGDISSTTPALALVKSQVPGSRSDAELVHADLSASSDNINSRHCTHDGKGTTRGTAQTSTASGHYSRKVQEGPTASGHRTVPLKVSHSKATHESASPGPVRVPPPEAVTDNTPSGGIRSSDKSTGGDGSPRTSIIPHGSRSNGVSSRLRPPGWARATAPTTIIQPAQCAASSRKGSSPSGETTTSPQMLTPVTEVAEVIAAENRSDASCYTRNTVRATPALPSCPQPCRSGEQVQSRRQVPIGKVKVGRHDSSQPVVMVVDYHHMVDECSTVSSHKSPAKSRRRRSGSAADKHCWNLPSSLEDHRCHLAIAGDGRSGPTGSSYSSRSTEKRYGREASGYRSCETSSYLEAMGRRERCSARFEAQRRRAAMARAARKTRASATIGDRAPWGKGRETPAEAERRKLLQRRADYACGLREKAQGQAQAARLYLSKAEENVDSSNGVPEARLPMEAGLSNDDMVGVVAVRTARVGGSLAGRVRGVVPLPCEISPESPVPSSQGSKRLPRVSAVVHRGKKAECGTGRCSGGRDDDRDGTKKIHGPNQRQGSRCDSLVVVMGEEEQLVASIARLDGLLHNATANHHGSRNHSPTPRADRSDKRPGVEGGGRGILPANHESVTNTGAVGKSGSIGKTRRRKGGGEESKQRGSSTLTVTPTPGDDHCCVPVGASGADAHGPVISAISDGMAQKAPVKFPPLFSGSRFPRDRGGCGLCFTEGVVCHETSHHHEGRL